MEVLWIYGLLALTTAPPLLPNSGLLVTAGVLASRGNLDLAIVLLVVAGSAVLGDLLMHATGRRYSDPVRGWMGRSHRRKALLDWLAVRLERRGVPFVAAVRFLPSGRLVGGLAAGVVGYPARRYLIGAGIAEGIWATYSVGLGYLGSAASGNPLYAAAIGIGVSAVVAAVGGLVQAGVRRRRVPEPSSGPGSRDAEPVVGERPVRGGGPAPGGGPVGEGGAARPPGPAGPSGAAGPCRPVGPYRPGCGPLPGTAPGAVLGRATERGQGCRAAGASAVPPAGPRHPAPRTGSR
ncbi:DedA family protein [Streptomyces sp. NPDC048639]|uniref:DedA family protein n=1 Tax=Streptomyces sp. NPDC048639 TaxID=3365581 RepID=UPI0037167945